MQVIKNKLSDIENFKVMYLLHLGYYFINYGVFNHEGIQVCAKYFRFLRDIGIFLLGFQISKETKIIL